MKEMQWVKKSVAVVAALAGLAAFADATFRLAEMDVTKMYAGWGESRKDKSVARNPLSVGGVKYATGVGTHAPSKFRLPTGGNALSFRAKVGVDDEAGERGSVVFRVWADGRLAAEVAAKGGEAAKDIRADLAGAKLVTLEVTDGSDGNDYDHADWLEAAFAFKDGTAPLPLDSMTRQLGILTPPAGPSPRINAPARYGARPGRQIFFRLPVVGEGPVTISATPLWGLSFDPAKRMVTGSIDKPGEYPITFTAKNAHGEAAKTVVFVIGEKLCLTPPMGFSTWNAFAGKVTDEKVRIAADKMVELGLIEHGYAYCNIDDYWQNNPKKAATDPTLAGPERNPDGTINPNVRFPDMKGLADYIHSKGLKAGLYSSPGPYTCGGCTGSWLHELQDAKTYAEWGYDYLKYDMCSYFGVMTGEGRERDTRPYLLMGRFLRMQPRDIVYSLCQYGREDVETWGELTGGQLWRTTGDIFDRWGSVRGGYRAQARRWMYSRPGAWNDADMLVLGRTTWSNGRLTHNECYTHMSMWSMCAAPLMIGCDLASIDDFTLSLLTNDEVLAIDQDELGAAAACVLEDKAKDTEVWARPLADGTMAFALVNADDLEQVVTVPFAKLGMRGAWKVRDLWRQSDVGEVADAYAVSVPGHATHLVKLTPCEGAGLKPCLKDIRDNAWRLSFDADRMKKAGGRVPEAGCARCD